MAFAIPGYASGLAPAPASWAPSVSAPTGYGASAMGGGGGVGAYTAPDINYANIGQISDIAGIVNQLNRQAQSASLGARIPGGPQLEAKSSQAISGLLSGQLPPDVERQLRTQAAEMASSRGISGSPASDSELLRLLGINSLQTEQMGQQQLSAAEGRNPAAPIFDVASQLITPYQAAQLGLQASSLARGGAGGTRTASPGYGAPASPFAPTSPGDMALSATPGTTGYVPGYAWQSDPTAAWLASIGYTAGTGGTPGTGTTMFDTGGGAPSIYTGSTPSWQQLFSTPPESTPVSDLGIPDYSGASATV